jgi:signal transduction histidine kinase
LGLAIVKQLVEALGGRVTVISRPGAGSRFNVELPWTNSPPLEPPSEDAASPVHSADRQAG